MEEQAHEKYPVRLTAEYPEKSSRWLALATVLFMIPKLILLLPHFVLLYFLQIVASFAWIFGQIAVLFTGKYPRGFYDFVLGVMRWQVRFSAYMFGITDKYPPFHLK